MALRQGLSQSLGQEQLLLPRMLQSVELLALPAQELEGWLAEQAEKNEALVVDVGERREWTPPRASRGAQASLDHDEWLQAQPARAAGTHEALEEQLAWLELDDALLGWARCLIAHVDERGFLAADDETLIAAANAQGLSGGEGELARALALVRTLEPRGVGARNAIDALLMQLDPDEPHYAELCALLRDFLGELASNKLPAVARAMDLSMGELDALLARLRGLDPRPLAHGEGECAPVIVPDVHVERDGDGFAVRVERGGIPSASIDAEVERIARDRAQPREVRSYLRDKLQRARWIVDALEQRSRTLQRVSAATFHHQRAFLEHGPGHLAPLAMHALAGELGIHVSTVSRAVAGKHVATPWGTFALRHFFQSAAGSADCARDEAREAVRAIVAAEDATRPLSDDDIVERLRTRGLELARRTVAKYRDELGIASSYKRRKFDAA